MARASRKSTSGKPGSKDRTDSGKKAQKVKKATKTPRKVLANRSKRTREKDPKGGLTAGGRAAFRRTEGAHLKPGVKKSISQMTPQEMRRKGSWAVRFYGRDDLPALVDANGKPTRFALSAHAWGEPVPKTVPAARRIAAKGRKLLARYERTKRKATSKKNNR